MTPWVCDLSFVGAAGNLTQLYPATAAAGTAIATATPSQLVREPTSGECAGIQVATDGVNGGILQVYDINGNEAGADVSAGTAITNAQLVAAIAAGNARLIYEQNIDATGVTPPNQGYFKFMRGLAARFVAAAGACKVNLRVDGGVRLRHGSV